MSKDRTAGFRDRRFFSWLCSPERDLTKLPPTDRGEDPYLISLFQSVIFTLHDAVDEDDLDCIRG